ncbi:MAG TPA: hypothetical protein VE528_05415 [Thermoleophilaceae bacterium]|nr:hypothetical protein [Thermoleophilaceae bacterium]
MVTRAATCCGTSGNDVINCGAGNDRGIGDSGRDTLVSIERRR